MEKSKYLKIVQAKDKKDCYIIFNTKQNTKIATIEKIRVGRFMHWCLCPLPQTYFTNGCLKEISDFITNLYTNEKINTLKPKIKNYMKGKEEVRVSELVENLKESPKYIIEALKLCIL